MTESFRNIEDEPFPSFLSASLNSSHATLGNVTLGSTLGVPVAASTVAKIRARADNRTSDVEASYLDDGKLSLANSQTSNGERGKFALSFKDELDGADDFIAAHRLSDMLVKIHMEEGESASMLKTSSQGRPLQAGQTAARVSEHGHELSTGLITFSHLGGKDVTAMKARNASPETVEEECLASDGADGHHLSASITSFLANEKLLSVNSLNSDATDDDLDMDPLHDDELEVYFNKLLPPAMQRGRVEGQEIPQAELTGNRENSSHPSATEPEKNRCNFLEDYDQDDFQMLDVRLAATGMDSCPASDEEDTEDELEAVQRRSSRPRFLLPSTSRQLVGESNHPNFRPGLEGGSSEDEPLPGARTAPSNSGIEFRRSAEGQVINSPVTGDGGGGGDGSSGSEENGNDGGVSTIPLPPNVSSQAPYDTLRGLGMVGASGEGDEGEEGQNPGLSRASVLGHSEMGDRVGPVGTGEAGSSGVGQPRVSAVNWTMTLDRQEALDGMDSTESAAGTDGQLDSLYLQNAAGHWRPPDASSSALLQGTLQSTFHLSQVLPSHSVPVEEEAKESLGLRGGPCGYSTVPDPSDSSSEGEDRAASLEPKYLSQTGQGEELDDVWSQCPDNIELDFQPGPTTTHNVVYQNEEGRWVTDLAYYSSFEKEAEMNLPEEIASQFQTEEFVSGNDALDKIIEDEEEFEKENQFIQEEQIAAQSSSLGLADTSWRLPSSNYILMRASQASSEFERGNQSYLRLSLGEFFQQRSEALGCLGDAEEDAVKRPSFGYVITSPEKREPFALIRPSDFSSRGSSVHSDTLHHSDADDTLHPEDLNKTFEATMEKLAHKEDEHSVGVEKEAAKVSLPHAPETAAAPGKCTDSPNNLLLSISTIATAIADASLSSDPAQLAAMILELSKKSRSKSQSPRGAGGMSQAVSPADQSVLLEALHKSVSAGELSSFDIEKYLRKTEASGSDSDCSASPHCFDILSWADSFRSSSKLFSPATPVRHEEPGAAAPHAGRNVSGMPQKSRKTSVVTPCSSAPPSVGPCKKSEGRRSTIPRPKASCIPTASASGSRRSVGKRPSTLSTQARLADTPGLNEGPEREAPSPVSSNRSGTETAARLGMAPVHTPSSGVAPSRSPASCSASSPSSPVPADSTLPSTWNGPPLQSQAPDPLRQGSDPREGETTCPFDKEPPGKSPAVFLSSMEKHQGFAIHSPQPGAQSNPGEGMGSPQQCAPPRVEESHCAFRPSTSPLTHSSPSQSSLPSADGMASCPASPASLKGGHDSLSPQSHCSSPSLSRLTYISLNNSTALPTPDRNKSNNSIALSTTIVRASPTPMVEQELPHGSPGDVLVQTNTLDLQSQNRSTDVRSLDCHYAAHSTARKGCEYNLPEIRERLPKRCPEPTPQHLTQGDSGYSSNLQQPGASDQQHPLHWASGTDKQELRGGFGFPVSFASDNPRFLPSSTFKPQAPHLDPQPSVPSLLTGRSLFSSQLAQQYLGAEVPLHPYHTGAATAGYGMCPVVSHANPPSVGHVHGPSASGPVLPQGYMNPSQLHRAHLPSLESGLLGAGKPYGHLGTMGMWPTAGFNDVGAQVVVPEELKFPNACCVGIASQTTLSIFNPTERWLQVGIAVTGLAIDGEKVESLPYQWLMVKNKTIIGPKSTEEQKVLFIPPRVGLYQCILSVSSWPTAAESEAAVQAQVFAKRVVLIAMAETPSLEVDVGTTGCLDFGDLSVGSARALPLKLINKTRATVPIRLVISANALAWRCFTFSKSPVAVPTDGMLQTGSVAPLAAPSVMNHVMHANYRDNPESFMVWVHFHAPQKYTPTSGALGPADEYCARVDIELDSPGPSQVIRSVQLRARSGTARVHAPKDLQTVSLISMLGKSSKQTLPLKNAGNINAQLKLKSSDSDDCFLVKPEELLLQAGEEQGITVCFTPKGTRKYRESVLTILVLPSGPQYEVVLKGEVAPEEAPRRFSASPSKAAHMDMPPAGTVPPILSNKQFMAWGGVTLGRAVQQKLVLRNNSPSAAQQLRLLVRGQDQDCFQLQSTFGPEERLTRHRELSIRPKEDVAVHLLFAPTRVACMLAKLEIKQSGVRPSQPGIKFTIPLSGYGGTSNIILEDVKKLSDSYVVTLNGVGVGRVSKVCLSMRNTGSRAAFIRAMAYSDLQARTPADPSIISMMPTQFVLKERTQEVVTVLLKATIREQDLCQSGSTPLATVCFYCGDEVSRQQFRRFLQGKPDAGQKVLSENSLLKNINFNEQFLGEEQVTEVYDLPQRPNEAQLFYGSLSKVVLSVLGSGEASDSGESDCMDTLQPLQRQGSESDSGIGNSDRHISNVSLDVLPVKGPQGPPLSLNVAAPALKDPSNPGGEQQDSWSIQPEQLVLTAPTLRGAADTGHVQIRNCSLRELHFELSWPAHCLTITPQHGVIEPESHLQILISPNLSLASKSSLLPWSGQIYIQCDDQQKFIKVQIRQDLALDTSATASSAKPLSALPPQPETPPVPGGKAVSNAPTHVEIRNRTIVFPAAASGETSESVLEVENKGEEVRWYLSSFAPTYVKGVDSSGDVYRATYTAFRCTRVSGTLGPHEKMQVPITFLPRDRGDYAQFWDLECHPVAEPQQKSRTRFQLCGKGVKPGEPTAPQERDGSLVRTEAMMKARKRPEAPEAKTSQEEVPRRGLYAPQDLYTFPPTRAGESSTLKVNMRNNSFHTHELKFVNPREPFYIKHSKYSLRSQHYINLPVQFKPGAAGQYSAVLLVQTDTSSSLRIQLSGEALP